MGDLSIWVIIIGLTMVTIATRSSFLVLGERFALPQRVQHALRYAPACALAALIAPDLFLHQGTVDLSASAPRLAAGFAAAITMVMSRSMMAAMGVGMIVFTIARWLP